MSCYVPCDWHAFRWIYRGKGYSNQRLSELYQEFKNREIMFPMPYKSIIYYKHPIFDGVYWDEQFQLFLANQTDIIVEDITLPPFYSSLLTSAP